MATVNTTPVPVTNPAKQLPAWEAGVFTVLHGILGALSLDPSTKASLTQTLNDGASTIANVVEDAPALAASGVEEGVNALGGSLVAAEPVAAIPVEIAENVAEPIVGDLADEIVSRLESVFISHNKNTIAAVGSLLGSDEATVTAAQAKVVPTV